MGQIEYCSRLVAIKDLIQILQGLECKIQVKLLITGFGIWKKWFTAVAEN